MTIELAVMFVLYLIGAVLIFALLLFFNRKTASTFASYAPFAPYVEYLIYALAVLVAIFLILDIMGHPIVPFRQWR
jgi:hypothetical protein